MKLDGLDLYICASCGELFPAPTWHCPLCGHHEHEADTECGNCHHERIQPAGNSVEAGEA